MPLPPTRETDECVLEGDGRSCTSDCDGDGLAAEGEASSGERLLCRIGESGDPIAPFTRALCRCLGSPKRQ